MRQRRQQHPLPVCHQGLQRLLFSVNYMEGCSYPGGSSAAAYACLPSGASASVVVVVFPALHVDAAERCLISIHNEQLKDSCRLAIKLMQ